MSVDTPGRLKLLLGTSLLCCREEDCTCGLVIEVFDDSDKVSTDILLHDFPHCRMPNPIEGLLEVYEDMVEVSLKIFLTKVS